MSWKIIWDEIIWVGKLYESKLYELKLYEMQLYESKLYEMLLSPKIPPTTFKPINYCYCLKPHKLQCKNSILIVFASRIRDTVSV